MEVKNEKHRQNRINFNVGRVYTYCFITFKQMKNEDIKVCETCGSPMRPEYDNVGFEEPNGPSKLECVGYKCLVCWREDDEPED